MDRGPHQPLSVAEAKIRLLELAEGHNERRTAGVGVPVRAARAAARQRPWVALGMALLAGVVAGASPRARAFAWTALERTLL